MEARGPGSAAAARGQVPRVRRSPARCLQGLLLALAATATAAPASKKKAAFSVNAEMHSAWPKTSLAAQSLEFIRDVDAAEAAVFLRQLNDGGLSDGSSPSGSAGELAAAETLIRSSSARTFHELLARNSYYSPRIELLRSLERQDRRAHGASCKLGVAWALLWTAGAAGPTTACDAAALQAALAKTGGPPGGGAAMPADFVGSELDLVLRQGPPECVVVLYGALDAEGLPGLAALLAEVDRQGAGLHCKAVFRHADGPADPKGAGVDVLTGYGFELAIKSSEYKTHADENKDGEGEEAKGADSGDQGAEDDVEQQDDKELDGPLEIDGLLFDVLLKRPKGVVRSRLWALKEQLEAERDTDAVLKAWEIKDIGLQATAKIKSSSTPLLALMRLSQNFPAHVAGLARTSVPEALKRSLSKLRNTIRENAEGFSVNNRLVRPDHSDLSLFPMMKTLQPFFIGVERLVRTGTSETLACELLKESSGIKLPERLDWRSPQLPPPSYLVTKDKKSARWPTSLQQLMFSFMGGLSPIRLALYHVVFVFDPADLPDIQQASLLLQQTPLPMSLHFVMLPGARASGATEWDEQALGKAPDWISSAGSAGGAVGGQADAASTAIAASYSYLLAKSPAKARKYLKALAESQYASMPEEGRKRWPSSEVGLAAAKEIFTQSLAAEEQAVAGETWSTIVAGATSRRSAVANATEYVATLGVPVPCVMVNGKLLLKGAYEGKESIYPSIGYEQQVIQRAVYMGQLQSGEKVQEYLESQGLLSAYHEDITPDVAQRGGEEGMPGQANEAAYVQWPAEGFLAQPFLQSLETEGESAPVGRLGFYHVTVLRKLSHAHLLYTFASHMLAPDRAALASNKKLKVPPFSSHWAPLVDVGAEGDDSALAELKACVSGALHLDVGDAEDAVYALNRQRLLLLKFMGQALPAAASSGELSGKHARELCELAIDKKIDPEYKAKVRDAIAAARPRGVATGSSRAADGTLLAAAVAAAGDGSSALWVCNGRQIMLEAGGQPVSPRHVQALELLEAQYDVSREGGADDDEEMPDQDDQGAVSKAPAHQAKALFEFMAEEAANSGGAPALPLQAHALLAAIRSEALSYGKNDRFTQPSQIFEVAPAAFRLQLPPARPDAASPIKVFGVMDPLSQTAQSASAVLALFGMAFNAEVNLVLNPIGRLTEYPLKRYYREVIRWPAHLADGRRVEEIEGFGDAGRGRAEVPLATKHTLTAAIHAMPTWLVTAHEAAHDMDNLRLVDVGDGKACEATYMLRSLYVEGQAFLLDEDGWPVASAKGLQIDVMPKGTQEIFDDTIVMGNLGYFQVKGPPGLYDVGLKPGLSNDTFLPVSVKDLQVASYITPPYQLRVRTRPGRSHEDLFEEGKGGSSGSFPGTSGRLSSLFGGLASFLGEQPTPAPPAAVKAAAPAVTDTGLPTIHIFSVASGHLYEKLLGIMIMSVRNRTKCPLHFWFIDQFLSPNFKEFIPKFARRYNFNFDFVTYKWPSWLNPQSEKQRLIWAYKILFLDVLFPMDVPKVIFIDADQVVRADVRELWDIDLQGKVYGFTPMGNTNPDTEGFRFWKQGYWANHLGGVPYHISALFVVDLVEFRRTSIGDQLRGIYNQLSRDPNSLANLDQDLPNFAQHQIPIFSLPEDWLWCETWCSQESKPRAKTIDLCQNPLTKEPKIVMAKRIISEWQTYHDEVQRFQEGLEQEVKPAVESPGEEQATKPEL